MSDKQHSRLHQQFEQLLQELIRLEALTEQSCRNLPLPTEAGEIVPRLWEGGIDDVKLAQSLSNLFKRELFNGVVRDRDSLIRSSNDRCPWLIVDRVLYVSNPYDRSQIEPLMRRKNDPKDKLKFEKLGILAMSDFESDLIIQATHDQGVSVSEVSGAWAKGFVDELLNEAISFRASDIHIEPESHGGVIKFRIDGRCQVCRIPGLQTIERERFRLVANNLMERVGKQNNYLEPCSGYLVFQSAHKQVSMRLEMAPVKIYSEIQPKITIRLLNNQRGVNKLESLGLSPAHVTQLRSLGHRANGMLVITGPTGSGKSTTLKAILKDIRDNFPEKAIYSIEDPVEDQLDGITSLEVTKHMGFAKALRSLLRHDPDVIMVGEIRDGETAELALRASMTGHLVLTTLHTNDSHGAINRLRNLGLDNALMAENLMAVTAQRLVNKVCPHCSTMVPITQSKELWAKYQHIPELKNPEILVPVVSNKEGCQHCNFGYTGRHLVCELFMNDPDSESQIIEGLPSNEIRRLQTRRGVFNDLWDDGIRLVREGVTTLEALENRINPIRVARAYRKADYTRPSTRSFNKQEGPMLDMEQA
ncbi:MAG: GspE/PulE family protein [Ketobacter sp.]